MEQGVHYRECVALLQVSRALLEARTLSELLDRLPGTIATAFAIRTVVLDLPDLGRLFPSITNVRRTQEALRSAEQWTASPEDESTKGSSHRRVLVLMAENKPSGYLLLEGAQLSDEAALQLKELVGAALHGALLLDQAFQAEIAGERSRDRRALAEFLEQELRSSLTALKGAASSLLCMEPSAELRKELLTIVSEESDRINRSVSAASLLEIQVEREAISLA